MGLYESSLAVKFSSLFVLQENKFIFLDPSGSQASFRKEVIAIKDLNCSLKELDIQLNKTVNSIFQWELRTRRNPSLGKPHPPEGYSFSRVKIPRKFRFRRALAIAVWYFPELLKYEILLQLSVSNYYSLDESTNGFQQSLELSTLTKSKEIMLKYLKFQEEFSARELFGTILHDDLIRALDEIRIIRGSTKVKRTIRRKGYRDHGSRRPSDRWIERFDLSFIEQQNLKEEKLNYLDRSFTFSLEILESWDPEN